MSERDSEQELAKAFILFSQNKDHIEFEDLKRIAKELGENMSDDELKEMMYEANKQERDPRGGQTSGGIVTRGEFMQILTSNTE